MSKPLTITPEVERVARECNPTVAWMEVDALRAALAAAEAKLADERKHADALANGYRAMRERVLHVHTMRLTGQLPFECRDELSVTTACDRWIETHAARRAARDGQEGTR